ncbi:MAG: hypothetical protein ACP5N7_00555 [Candidatus Pacearchaeota archaeon]|nr:hypothetical protein [Saprospiraceae bacterium]
MAKVCINRFYEKFYEIMIKKPELNQGECYEMAEKWYIWKFGKRRYRNYNVFRSAFHRFLKNAALDRKARIEKEDRKNKLKNL